MKYFKKIKPDFFLIFLILIAVFLCYKNYTPNTFLSGWDTLHPEFDLNLYWQRITSVWQEHQGLGAPPSQAHVAEIPRMIFLFLSSLIFPLNFIRYSYFFLMIILGPVGVYLFLKESLKEDCLLRRQSSQNSQSINKIASFLGALFYLLNLGTMQHFIVPLEMFATKFGFLGFLYLFALKFLNEGKRKNLIIFCILTVLASPMAHTATLWYVYFAGLILFLVTYSLLTKNTSEVLPKKSLPFTSEVKNITIFKKSLLLITLTLLLNLYWILPNLYYAINYNHQVINSKIHRLGTEELYYHNQKYGTISDLLLFKNFLFDWYVTNNSGQNQPLLAFWSQHLKNPNILIIGYFLSSLSLIGVIFALHKKNAVLLSFIPLVLFSSFFLLSDTPGVSIIFNWLRSTTPLLKEVFRFPFTKFSIYLIFCFSLFFAYFHKVLLNKLATESGQLINFLAFLYLYFFLFILVIYTLPAFQGNFISSIVRVKIPSEYFSLFNWSNKQDHGRILLLSIHDPYGWAIYNWNQSTRQAYQGAGFTWFGLRQPSLNSEFNRWYPYNEQAYREFFYAVYSKNSALLEKLLAKYNIKYILLDENVIIPGDEAQAKKLFYPEIKELLAQLGGVLRQIKKFGEKISLFEYLPNKEKKPVEILTDYKIVEPNYRWNYVDEAYKRNKDYINVALSNGRTKEQHTENVLIYPARNVLTEQEKINPKILSIAKDGYQVTFEKSELLENGEIKIPSLASTESEFYSEIYAKKNAENITIELKYLLPYVASEKVYTQEFVLKNEKQRMFSINDKIFTLPYPLSEIATFLGEEILYTREENVLSFYEANKTEILPTHLPLNLSPSLCSPAQENQIFGAETTAHGFKIYGQKAKICLEIPLKELINIENEGALRLSYDYQTEENGKTQICLFNKDRNKCVESFLPIGQEKSNSLYLKFSFDTTNSNTIKELLIKNIVFNFYKKMGGQLFFAQIPQFELTTEEFKLEGRFPEEKTNIRPENIGQEKKDCGFEKAKFIDKQFITTDEGIVLEYKAIDGSICDTFSFANLSQNSGYLLGIESQNVNGLPIKICLENDTTKNCDLEERLSKNKDLQTDYFIIPPYFNGFGYNLLLNNYSIGDVLSTNRIKTIQIIPFPYNFFQSVRWESNKQENVSINRLIDTKIKQFSPWLYLAEIKEPIPPSSVLVLNQAYEKNWRAWLNGRELKDHVLVNNWANAWLIRVQGSKFKVQGGSNMEQLNNRTIQQFNNLTIIIIFLPQFLEFLGFGLLALPLLWVCLRYKNI
jgi:hypothetical protein